ncbi:Enoyl-CoA hydratase [Heyndrickxia coagulans]|nr:Enoyl-CoA hydratase [Heyndrickxia coagulans]
MRYTIQKAAVIGSGVMGSGIAAHLANIGIPVLLLDIVPNALTEAEKAKGTHWRTKPSETASASLRSRSC